MYAEQVFGSPDAVLVAGATLAVVLVDGVGTRCAYQLRDIAAPPLELRIPRPADVPVLITGRDPEFVHFRLTGIDAQGAPVYAQIVTAPDGQ